MKRFITCLALAFSLLAGNALADRAQYVPDIVVTATTAPWTDMRTFTESGSDGGFVAAVAAMNSQPGGGTLLVSQDVVLTTSPTLDADVTLRFTQGSTITIPNGQTLTIKGDIDVGLQQIFIDSDTTNYDGVKFSTETATRRVLPEWWGAAANASTNCYAAIQSACTSIDSNGANTAPKGVVQLSGGNYIVTGTVTIPSGVAVKGLGQDQTRLTGTTNVTMFQTDTSLATNEFIEISDMYLVSSSSANTIALITIGSTSDVRTTHINIHDLALTYGGIKMIDTSYWTMRNLFINTAYIGLELIGPPLSTTASRNVSLDGYASALSIQASRNYGIYIYGFVDAYQMNHVSVDFGDTGAVYIDGNNAGAYGHWYNLMATSNEGDGTAAYPCINVYQASNTYFDSLHIEGGSSSVNQGTGILISASNWIRMSNSQIVGFDGPGLRVLNSSYGNYTGVNSWDNGQASVSSQIEIESTSGQSSSYNTFTSCKTWIGTADVTDYGFRMSTNGTSDFNAFLGCTALGFSNATSYYLGGNVSTYACSKSTSDAGNSYLDNYMGSGTSLRGLIGTTIWNPGSIGSGSEDITTITVTGAALGDMVLVSSSIDVSTLTLTGYVSATNTVTVSLANNTGGAVDLDSATWTAIVIPN